MGVEVSALGCGGFEWRLSQPATLRNIAAAANAIDRVSIRSMTSAQVVRREAPIDQLVQHGLDMDSSAFLVIQVISVFPQVYN